VTTPTIILTDRQIHDFRERVYAFFAEHGRPFPWRDPRDPYEILVSEVMLQQTQADRVVPYYNRFLDRYPDITALSRARLATILKLWQGLGYNRRAKLLHDCAKYVTKHLDGQLPTDQHELEQLPGIGPYTASAIAAFAGNRPAMVIETNIRSVFIHEFFGDREGITDAEIIPLIEQTVDADSPRQWYSALMDYGAFLKRQGINPSRRSAHHVRQAPLKGSNREVRGAIIRELAAGPLASTELTAQTAFPEDRLAPALAGLAKDGLIRRTAGKYRLA
jgi:A/G-specific adenine glycosylase